ncbi:HNH endonuclease [Salinimicrobium terrae]|uniref:HNH endonuclease n=1 Tax=Salinimicrobium terrae TaxID=470866 RepID=UPI0004161FA4|nr:HNH endonuclease [Salinimicrobium terrae]
MNQDLIAKKIEETLGIAVSIKGAITSAENIITVRPHGFQKNRGISVESRLRWKTLTSELVFEDFAGHLFDFIGKKKKDRDIFFECYNDMVKNNSKKTFHLSINGSVDYDINKTWSSVKLKIEHSPIDTRHRSEEDYISEQTIQILQCFFVFFEVYEEQEEKEEIGLPEGAVHKVLVNKYERSKINRSICLQHFGSDCQVCGFNFKEKYGEIGEGYIHVHHIIPVSQLGNNYQVNPIKDLIPLCPNCHAMVHKKSPPMEVEELRNILCIKSL